MSNVNEIKIKGSPPLVINAFVSRTGEYHEGGPVSTREVKEPYILLSSLPEDLRTKVVDAINVLLSGQ